MIQIAVKLKHNKIVSLDIKGHAGSDVYGHDLVCAIVSGISVGLCNALDQLVGLEDMKVEEGHVLINVNQPNSETELILRTGLIQLQTAQEVNQDFIIIKLVEV